MNVTISVLARFHAFYLAHEMDRHGALRRLITTYPAFEAAKYGVPRSRVTSLLWIEALNRLVLKLPPGVHKFFGPVDVIDLFEARASACIPSDTQLLVAWSGLAERSFQKAKPRGIKTVLERGSMYIDATEAILQEEYQRLGLPPRLSAIDPRIRAKEKREYELADFISIPSSHVETSFVQAGIPKEKLLLTPFGADLRHFKPGAKTDDVFRVIHCGRLSLRKGIPYLLLAFSELRLPKAELWLIGPIADEVKPYLKQYESPSIKTLGPFPEFELQKYYSQGSVYCLMSLEEGMAMTLVQAMACGLPVVCTNHTGGQDVVREGIDGFVLPPRDVDGLKEKLTFLYENKDARRAMGKAAAENVAAHFTWEEYGQRMLRHYEKILSAPPQAVST